MADGIGLGREKASLRERFPALARLERRVSRRRVPFVQGLQVTDCGAACLTMVLRFMGREARLEEVQRRMGYGRDGATALAIINGAHSYGVRARAVRMEPDDIDYLKPGDILHWRMQHFVVLDRVTPRGVEIVDPALGRRKVSMAELGKSFTGVALLFEPAEHFERVPMGRSRVFEYVRRMLTNSRLLTQIIALSIFAQLFGLALPLVTGVIVDRVVPRADLNLLTLLALGVALLSIFSFTNSLLRSQLLLHLQTNLDLRLTLDFLDHMMRLPFSFFLSRQTGDLMMRLNSNTTIREIVTATALSGFLDGILVFSYLLGLLLTHFKLGCLIAGLGLLRIGIYFTTRARYRDLMSKGLQAQANSSNYQVQMLSGIETLKSAGVERLAVTHWSNLLVDTMNVSLERGRLDAVVQSLLTALGSGSALVLLCYGANLVLKGDLSLGNMLAMTALAGGFLGPLSSLVSTALSLQTLGSYVERVEDVLATVPEQEEGARDPAPRLSGQIELRNLSFRYNDTGPLVLDDVSVRLNAGMKVGIVGRSGSGKSTLARLLVGLFEPTSGEILYDGLKLSSLDLQSVRRQCGFVPQTPHIFGTSIRRNIALAYPELPLAEIEDAAEMAHIHHEIVQMPLKYDTPITVGGASLAGGQRQRLALARALAGHPVILILDEGTSHLDGITESRVHANLATLRCTCIVIAHRMSTIVDSDLILVLDGGKVVERGTHAELIAAAGSYAKQFSTQARETSHFERNS